MPNTKLQMLLRGQNLVGYRHYADDVLERDPTMDRLERRVAEWGQPG